MNIYELPLIIAITVLFIAYVKAYIEHTEDFKNGNKKNYENNIKA